MGSVISIIVINNGYTLPLDFDFLPPILREASLYYIYIYGPRVSKFRLTASTLFVSYITNFSFRQFVRKWLVRPIRTFSTCALPLFTGLTHLHIFIKLFPTVAYARYIIILDEVIFPPLPSFSSAFPEVIPPPSFHSSILRNSATSLRN